MNSPRRYYAEKPHIYMDRGWWWAVYLGRHPTRVKLRAFVFAKNKAISNSGAHPQ